MKQVTNNKVFIFLYRLNLGSTASTLYALCLPHLYAQCVQCRNCRIHILQCFYRHNLFVVLTLIMTTSVKESRLKKIKKFHFTSALDSGFSTCPYVWSCSAVLNYIR